MSYAVSLRAVNQYQLNDFFKYVICFSFLLIGLFTIWGFRALSHLFSGSFIEDADSSGNITSILLFFVVLVSFMARFIYIISCGDNLNGSDLLYRLAAGGNYEAALNISPLTCLYARLLSFLFNLFGMQAANIIYLNVIFDIAAMLLIFFCLDKLANNVIGLIGACIFALFSCDYMSLTSTSPDKLYAFLFMWALYLILCNIRSIASHSRLQIKDVVLGLLAGLFTGVCCLGDFSGFGLVVTYLVLLLSTIKTVADPRRNRLKKSIKRYYIVELLTYMFFLLEGYLLIINLCTLGSKVGFISFIKGYVIKEFYNISFYMTNLFNQRMDIYYILLLGIASTWIVRLFKNKTDYITCLILPLAIWCAAVVLNINKETGGMFILCMLCLLDSLAIYSLFGIHQNEFLLQPNVENEFEDNSVFKRKNSKSNESIVSTNSSQSEARLKELEASLDFLKKAHEPEDGARANASKDLSGDDVDALATTDSESKDVDASSDTESEAATTNTVTAVYKEDEENNKPIKSRPYVPSYRSMQYKTAVVNKFSEEDIENSSKYSIDENEISGENEISDKYVVKKDATVTVAGETVSKTEMYNAMFGTGQESNEDDNDDSRDKEVEIVAYNRKKDVFAYAGDPSPKYDKEGASPKEDADIATEASSSTDVSSDAVAKESLSEDEANTTNEDAAKLDATTVSSASEVTADETTTGASNNDELADTSRTVNDVTTKNPSLDSLDSESTLVESTKGEDSQEPGLTDKDSASDNLATATDSKESGSIASTHRSVVELPKSSDRYNEAKESESSNKVEMIHNPLPIPKRHTPVEFDFDIEPESKDMHFDIVDLTGKDYFDIN